MSRDMVLVSWADAHSPESGWTFVTHLEDTGEFIVETIGWLLTEDDGGKTGHITVAQSIGPDDAADHIIHIPVGMVRKITNLIASTDLTHPSGMTIF